MEVLIFPTEEQEPEEVDIASVVQSLIGAIPATDLSLPEMLENRTPRDREEVRLISPMDILVRDQTWLKTFCQEVGEKR